MYEIRPIDLSTNSLQRYSNLIRKMLTYGNTATEAYLDWEYNQNPMGKAFGYDAYLEDQLISHCVLIPFDAILYGQAIKGVMPLNAATLPEHQGQHLYFSLAKQAHETAKEKGYTIGLSVTNNHSTPGFIKQVGYQLISPLDAMLGIGSVCQQTSSGSTDLEKVWNQEAILWRVSCPTRPYHLIHQKDSIQINGLTHVYGIQAIMGHVDYSSSLDKAGKPNPLSINPMRLWLGIDHHKNWRKSFYFNLPLKLRPSPLNLIFKDLIGNTQLPQTIKFSAIDFDAF